MRNSKYVIRLEPANWSQPGGIYLKVEAHDSDSADFAFNNFSRAIPQQGVKYSLTKSFVHSDPGGPVTIINTAVILNGVVIDEDRSAS